MLQISFEIIAPHPLYFQLFMCNNSALGLSLWQYTCQKNVKNLHVIKKDPLRDVYPTNEPLGMAYHWLDSSFGNSVAKDQRHMAGSHCWKVLMNMWPFMDRAHTIFMALKVCYHNIYYNVGILAISTPTTFPLFIQLHVLETTIISMRIGGKQIWRYAHAKKKGKCMLAWE